MTTIAECPAPENSVSNRVIKMAVIGGSGVGKTGKEKKNPPVHNQRGCRGIYSVF